MLGQCHGGLILHNIRDSIHSKLYGHGLHGESPVRQNTPVININNYQNVGQQSSISKNLPSFGGHNRGDYGTLSNYGSNMYDFHKEAGQFMNSNIKAGGLKYDGYGGYDNHHAMRQESYHHRQGPKLCQHHDPNIFGNTKIGSSTSSASSSSSSSHGVGTSSTSSAASYSTVGASSVSSSSSSSSSYSSRVKPWRY